MTLKNVFKLSTLALFFTLVLSSYSFGQTRYYVDVQNGLDGYNGLQANPGGPGVGPKQTIQNAIDAASSGDIISIAWANGNLYNENVVLGSKKLTFETRNGAPQVVSFTINNALASPDNITTFTGPIKFGTTTGGGLVLTAGNVVGATNITIVGGSNTAPGGTITRTAGAVDGQLGFEGLVNVTYNGGVAITSGGELPAESNTTNLGAITTTAGTVLTLNSGKTMNINGTGGYVLTTGAALNLGGFTLNLNTVSGSTAAVHTIGGHVTNGTLSFTFGTTQTVNGNFNLPTIVATKASGGASTLTLNTNANIGNITVNGVAQVAAPNATQVGSVTNNSTAATGVDLFNTSAGPVVTGAISNNAASQIRIRPGAAVNLTVNGNISQSAAGSILVTEVTGAGTITVNGSVQNTPTLTVDNTTKNAASNLGVIRFGNRQTSITGSVTANATFTGTATRNNAGTATTWSNTGEITFAATTYNVTINGGVVINAVNNNIANVDAGGAAAAATVSTNGSVIFGATTGNIFIPGGVTVSTTWPSIANTTNTENGSFHAPARTTGTLGSTGNRIGAILVNSSAANGANGNFNAGTGGGFWGTSITASGAAGGAVVLGNEAAQLSSHVKNERTSNYATGHIQFGTAQTGTLNVAIAGNLESTGSSTTIFKYFVGDNVNDETFSVTGTVKLTGGTIKVDDAAPLNGAGTFQLGALEMSGGTLDLTGAATSNMDVIINGSAKIYGGTLDIQGAAAITTDLSTAPVVVLAADRVLQLGGLMNEFSTTSARPTFNVPNTLLLIQPTAIIAAQTITGNLTTTVWPSQMLVKNPTGLEPAVTFNGGNFRVLGNVAFDMSKVHIDNVTLFIGGQLAPNVGTGSFYNHPGYITSGQGFISMNNNAGGGIFGGLGNFENFEVDCAVNADANNAALTFTKTFNLTNGAVINGGAIKFVNSVVYPTIVRNAGTFAVAPDFANSSMVNVYYIGLDKTTANELPNLTNKLYNLTVATTNGTNVAGRGAIFAGVATTVNGILEIFDNQALIIGNVNLTIKGPEVKLNNNGLISNTGGGTLVFDKADGTLVKSGGQSWLPRVLVNAGSLGNKIEGVRGFVWRFLGPDDLFGGGDDFNPTAGYAAEPITFQNGAGALELVLAGGAANGTNFGSIVTANASNVVTISSNVVSCKTGGGTTNLQHVAGNINIGAGFTWSMFDNGDIEITSGANINGPGTLVIRDASKLIKLLVGNVTIAAPVTVNLAAPGNSLTLDPASPGHLTLTNDLTMTQGRFVLGSAATARNLTLTGKNFSMTNNSSFAAHDGLGAYILGTLILNATTANAPMNWSYTGDPTLGNLTIANDVTLGGTGGSLTIYRTFTHSGGKLDFAAKNITIDAVTTPIDGGALAAAGTFNRTSATATYAATTGYLSIRTATFNQGADFSIPNLRFGGVAGGAAVRDAINVNFGTASNATVTSRLYLDIAAATNTITHTVSGSTRLTVADGADVFYSDGKFDANLNYAGKINLHSIMPENGGNREIHATVWRDVATLVNVFNVANTGTVATRLPGARTVNTELRLTSGTLNVQTANRLVIANNSTVRVVAGVVTLTAPGSISFGTGLNYSYEVNAPYFTGPELHNNINNITFTRTGAATVNNAVTLNSSVTINGNMDIRNDVTIPVPLPAIVVTVLGNVTIARDAETFTAATNPITNFNQSLVFGGAANQTIAVPDVTPPQNLGNIEIRKTSPTGIITLTGGNLRTGNVTFVNGHLVTGDHIVYLPAPTTGAVAGGALSQGFDRTQVVGGNVSHIVGNVGKTLVNFGAINTSTEFRNEFPVGTIGQYRPAAITFNPAFGVPTNPNVTIVVKYKNENPGGAKALPIANGVANGIDVARYPGFYWNIYTVPGSVGPTTYFDLELNAGAFTDYDSPSNVRIIRRHGTVSDLNNDWLLQGTNDSYDNEVTAISGFSAINRGANAGLRAGGAIFTLGLKSNMSVANPIPAQALMLPDAPKEIDLANVFEGNIGALAYTAQSSNPAVVTVAVSGTKLTLTQVALGNAQVTILAKDELNNDFFAYSFGVTVTPFVSVEELEVPTEYALYQNFPNPFNPTTNIKFALPSESNVTLKIYNVLGQEVMTLVNKVMNAGYHTVNFDASNLTSGMYIYRIEAENFVQVKKMLLMK